MTTASNIADDKRPFVRQFLKGVAQAVAIGCATLAVCAVLFLAAAHPSQMRCSSWIIPIPKGAWAPVWMLSPMVALWVVSVCFGAVQWGWLARQHSQAARPARAGRGDFVLTIHMGRRLILVMAACVLLCAAPIVVVLGSCSSAG